MPYSLPTPDFEPITPVASFFTPAEHEDGLIAWWGTGQTTSVSTKYGEKPAAVVKTIVCFGGPGLANPTVFHNENIIQAALSQQMIQPQVGIGRLTKPGNAYVIQSASADEYEAFKTWFGDNTDGEGNYRGPVLDLEPKFRPKPAAAAGLSDLADLGLA